MLFAWLKKRRRKRLLVEPFPDEWLRFLRRNVLFYAHLPTQHQSRLRRLIRFFVAEKRWVGCGGLRMDNEVKVTIAAQACLLLLGLAPDDDFCYERLGSILVYPGAFYQPEPSDNPSWDASETRLGEAWLRGPIILSWEHVCSSGRQLHDGRNLVIHEFAHRLDGLDGQMGGTPPLRTPRLREQWEPVVQSEFAQLESDVRDGRETFFDPYAATDRSEFFAVASEHFFEQPGRFVQKAPELYRLLEEFYQLDPVSWFGGDSRDRDSSGPFDRNLIEQDARDQNARDQDVWEQEQDEQSAVEAARLEPGSVDALFTRGVSAHTGGNYEQAIMNFTQAIHHDPEDGEIFQHRAEAYLELGQFHKSITDCDRALELDPADLDAYRTRGKAFLVAERYDQAVEDFSHVILEERKDHESWYRRGLAWMGLGRFEQAVRDFDQSIRQYPQHAEVYLARAKAYQALGDGVKADADLKEAMRLDPEMERG